MYIIMLALCSVCMTNAHAGLVTAFWSKWKVNYWKKPFSSTKAIYCLSPNGGEEVTILAMPPQETVIFHYSEKTNAGVIVIKVMCGA